MTKKKVKTAKQTMKQPMSPATGMAGSPPGSAPMYKKGGKSKSKMKGKC